MIDSVDRIGVGFLECGLNLLPQSWGYFLTDQFVNVDFTPDFLVLGASPEGFLIDSVVVVCDEEEEDSENIITFFDDNYSLSLNHFFDVVREWDVLLNWN